MQVPIQIPIHKLKWRWWRSRLFAMGFIEASRYRATSDQNKTVGHRPSQARQIVGSDNWSSQPSQVPTRCRRAKMNMGARQRRRTIRRIGVGGAAGSLPWALSRASRYRASAGPRAKTRNSHQHPPASRLPRARR